MYSESVAAAIQQALPHSPAADRNKQPILDVLRAVLPPSGRALEIAAGTGQHAAWFAAGLPGWIWQPTDADAAMLPAIAARISQRPAANVREPLLLDVHMHDWPSSDAPFRERFDAIYCANMLHIALWTACAALMRGSARYLSPGGTLLIYGPYLERDVVTSPGNVAFDQSLRQRDGQWGLRQLEDVTGEAASAGLVLRARYAMPANNLLLAFTPRGRAGTDDASGR